MTWCRAEARKSNSFTQRRIEPDRFRLTRVNLRSGFKPCINRCILEFEKTSLWRNSFGNGAFTDEAEARDILRTRLLDLRKRAEHLVALIHRDVPGLTVHDVTHLDALWETASLISGENYPLNPAEAFVFGAAVLLHDSAMSMAAYPKGLEEVKRTPEWSDAIASRFQAIAGKPPSPQEIDNPPEDIRNAALADVLREYHAKRASDLPFLEWPVPKGGKEVLIQDSELRNAYGNIIGMIAASHWWSTSDLRKLPPRVNAGPGVPAAWHLNPLKIACLLRVADAAHIDHRRAPRFLRALTKPTGISEAHWAFQGKLGKPSIENSFLVYTGSPFDVEEAEAWWICYDMLTMIDDELHAVHAVLDAYGIKPFAAMAVKGAKSPETVVERIPTKRWKPVNTELKVSDVPALIALLGGERLYGSDLAVPVRELIQNAADAIRAKRLVVPGEPTAGTVVVRLREEENGNWLEVEDDGVGMSPSVLTGALLDFGKSFWRSPALRREFPGLLSKGLKPTGQFGIGFFSVFMLGEHVTVTTRRFDAAASDTHTLDFRNGLRSRPILREPTVQESLTQPGTTVRVRLKVAANEPNGLLFKGTEGDKKIVVPLDELVARVCPAVDVTVRVDDLGNCAVAVQANDWLNEHPKKILLRVAGSSTDWVNRTIEQIGGNLRELKDSQTDESFGRACICPNDSWDSPEGVVTIGGFRASRLSYVAGVLKGKPETVSRDSAVPIVPTSILRGWATEQAKLIAGSTLRGDKMLKAATIVMLFGGDAGNLPIAVRADEYLSPTELEEMLRGLNGVEVFLGNGIDYDEDDNVLPKSFHNDFEVSENLFFVPKKSRSVLMIGERYWPECLPNLYVDGFPRDCEAAFEMAIKRAWGSEAEWGEDRRVVGMVDDEEIVRRVRVYTRPGDTSEYA